MNIKENHSRKGVSFFEGFGSKSALENHGTRQNFAFDQSEFNAHDSQIKQNEQIEKSALRREERLGDSLYKTKRETIDSNASPHYEGND